MRVWVFNSPNTSTEKIAFGNNLYHGMSQNPFALPSCTALLLFSQLHTTVGCSVSFIPRDLPSHLDLQLAVTFGREGSVSHLLSSDPVVCSTSSVCLVTGPNPLWKAVGHHLCDRSCNLQTSISLVRRGLLKSDTEAPWHSRWTHIRPHWALLAHESSKHGPFGAQCLEGHWR